jgi:(1->4)-alpha-D-glucan 1-alpha-D-glucosylmutase
MKTEINVALDSLAEGRGLKVKWTDNIGGEHKVATESIGAIMRALKLLDDQEAIPGLDRVADIAGESGVAPLDSQSRLIELHLPDAFVLKRSVAQTHELTVDIHFECKELDPAKYDLAATFVISEEQGNVRSGTADSIYSEPAGLRIRIPREVDFGYHHLKVSLQITKKGAMEKHQVDAERPLILTPTKCYRPSGFTPTRRLWGPTVNLATFRSKRNWGTGDLTDLKNVVAFCAAQGAGVVGVSPLHAHVDYGSKMFTPRLPTHRAFMSVLYVDVEAVEDFRQSDEARRLVGSPEFQKMLTELRKAKVADVRKVSREKLRVLDKLYQHFRSHHLNRPSARAREFRAFQLLRGETLRYFATNQAIAESLVREGAQFESWLAWPEKYKNPHSEAVQKFIASNNERIEFFEYVQWQADLQLQSIAKTCLNNRLPVGLLCEMSPLISRLGAEVWQNPEIFAEQLHVAEPPRPSLIDGHVTESPPFLIDGLRRTAYEPLAQILRESMRHAGAIKLRGISHWLAPVLTLDDKSLQESVILRQPIDEILSIIALESHRNSAMVIVDADDMLKDDDIDINSILSDWDIVSQLDVFNNEPSSIEQRLSEEHAGIRLLELAAPTLSPLAAFWQGSDLLALVEGELATKEDTHEQLVDLRVKQRTEILRLLEKKEMLPEGISSDPASLPIVTPPLVASIISLMARSGASIVLFRLDDLAAIDRSLVPYDNENCPDWRVKIAPSFEEMIEGNVIDLVVDKLQTERGCFFDQPGQKAQTEAVLSKTLTIPNATYRLQLNKSFTLHDAERQMDYLARLGISHLYLSPILEAQPGSMHCYDIVNHRRLNPELGAQTDLDRFCDRLRLRGMGIVLDLVPNHMGIGKHNAWWMDVLEHGAASEFAEYFDIEWSPVKKELHGKVLLPILGAPYGKVIRKGELHFSFNSDHGKFTVAYYDDELPLSPESYPMILGRRLNVLNERLGAANMDVMSYNSIVDALSNLQPGTSWTTGLTKDAIERRLREFQVSCHRLVDLCHSNTLILDFVQQNLKEFDAQEDDAAAIERVHELLEKQRYRLSFWRVAAQEINYRRFFDINTLAGVRVEDQRAFVDMHEYIFKLVEEGKVQGLRIDHPDGLFDPAGYFKRLQEQAYSRLNYGSVQPSGSPRQFTRQQEFAIYILGEKILAPDERMEQDWLVHGTTGYDFLNAANGLLVDGRNQRVFTEVYETCVNEVTPYEDLVYQSKQLIMQAALASELNVLAHHLYQIAESNWMYRDLTLYSLRHALSEVAAFFPVYRTYVKEGTVSGIAIAHIGEAVREAKLHNLIVHPGIFDFINDVLTLRLIDGAKSAEEQSDFDQAILTFAMKFQQFTGPVMAKSLEDTLFYKYNRFVGLNEVGGDPNRFGVTIADFHFLNEERQKNYPYSMLATSTHDTKRSEDVRARLSVLSEIPDNWQERVLRWMDYNALRCVRNQGKQIPTRNDEYLIYQTLVGTYPLELTTTEELSTYCKRIEGYVLKAMREAKENTSWINQNLIYEEGVMSFIRSLLRPENLGKTPDPFFVDFIEFHENVAPMGLIKSLTQTLLKFSCPGVPDLYLGNELFDFSLVDPDNRRPVDFALRAMLLEQMLPFVEKLEERTEEERARFIKELLKTYKDSRLKLYLTARALHLRKENPELFTIGRYIPIGIVGEGKDHFIAYARECDGRALIVIAPVVVTDAMSPDSAALYCGPEETRVWSNTKLSLPKELQMRKYTNALTGETVEFGDRSPHARTLLDKLPIAFLMR